MPYPFQPGLKLMEETSWKLKVLSVAGGVSIKEIIKQSVNYIWNAVEEQSPGKLARAKKEVGRLRP